MTLGLREETQPPSQDLADIYWSLLNSSEFLFNH